MTERTDKDIAEDLRTNIHKVAELMNEAKEHGIVVSFNINEVELTDTTGKPNGKKIFVEVVDIKKVEQL